MDKLLTFLDDFNYFSYEQHELLARVLEEKPLSFATSGYDSILTFGNEDILNDNLDNNHEAIMKEVGNNIRDWQALEKLLELFFDDKSNSEIEDKYGLGVEDDGLLKAIESVLEDDLS